MSNWYKKTITKAILILLALVTPVTAALSMVVLLGFSNGSVTPENLFPKGEKTYEESVAFEELMSQATMGVCFIAIDFYIIGHIYTRLFGFI